MVLGLLKRRAPEPVPMPEPEEVDAQEYSLNLHYRAKSSDGVRMVAGADAVAELPAILAGISRSRVELLEPLPFGLELAAPTIERPVEASQWLQAYARLSPIALKALVVLGSVEAIDPAFETVALCLLDGELDTAGYPRYNAIVGGIAAHWDEATGDMIVRGVVGWGGAGVRGDTDRNSRRILATIVAGILANQHALGVAPVERPMPAEGKGGLVCAHCGFSSAHARAFYCPKCGMRMLRG